MTAVIKEKTVASCSVSFIQKYGYQCYSLINVHVIGLTL